VTSVGNISDWIIWIKSGLEERERVNRLLCAIK